MKRAKKVQSPGPTDSPETPAVMAPEPAAVRLNHTLGHLNRRLRRLNRLPRPEMRPRTPSSPGDIGRNGSKTWSVKTMSSGPCAMRSG